MANYYCVIRTNYFHVKNETAFKEFMARVEGTEEAISLWPDGVWFWCLRSDFRGQEL